METAKIKNTAVILPVYNSERHLTRLIPEIQRYFPAEQIIAVNDGSTDRSAGICRELGIRLIDFTENRGKGAALQAGLKEADNLGYCFGLCMDSDEQHDPEHISSFLEKQQETGAGLIMGARKLTTEFMPWARICSNKLTSWIISVSGGKRISDSQCGYRLYCLSDLKGMSFKTKRYQFESEILLKLLKNKVSVAEVPVKTIYGNETSYINHLRDIYNFIKIIMQERIVD